MPFLAEHPMRLAHTSPFVVSGLAAFSADALVELPLGPLRVIARALLAGEDFALLHIIRPGETLMPVLADHPARLQRSLPFVVVGSKPSSRTRASKF
jgi:hypothetical protein